MSRSYQQQPSATHGMVVAPGGGGNRNAKNMPVDADGREWSNGMCSCMSECGTCMMATFVPCIVYGQNKHRYEHLNSQGTPHPPVDPYAPARASPMDWLPFAVSISSSRWSTAVTSAGGTTSKALTQESRELELEEESFSQRY
ncbi:hypothetical protein CPB84DRAFT_1828762 [Gymnopilus junonius]|uniref:Uncharacterized protein n=1 Tax=Gymnopilus junonius TaxID=109634 RepID=A0A9P5NBS9_GYMJU|nr:hypothetical protein CPB84DRAFT_1828762 [Gymnopilus junonius]